jgi:signal transduction histidine kinase
MPRRTAFSLRIDAQAMAWGASLVTVLLVALSYRATAESQRRTRELLERRAAEQFALLWVGLSQDMRGAHDTMLLPVTTDQLLSEPPYDLADLAARGFARFPYPESVFAWRRSDVGADVTYLFNRSQRPPPWQAGSTVVGPYPVEVVRNPDAMRDVLAVARLRSRDGRPVTVFDTTIDGVPYQIVARFFYAQARHSAEGEPPLEGFVGFTVNVGWVRRSYFQDLTTQISRIGGDPADVSLAVLDESGSLLTETQPPWEGVPAVRRAFPFWFADRGLLRHADRVQYWTVRAAAARDSKLASSGFAAIGTVTMLALAGLVGTIGLFMMARGARVASELAVMKADFVSSATHELKSPLAVIQLVADTLSQGRFESADRVRHYATLLSRETRNFTRLIENLLAYARLGDRANAYGFAATHIADLVEEALQKVHLPLSERQFNVMVSLPEDLPAVRADRAALLHVLDNLIDNAVKYSGTRKTLEVAGWADGGWVTVRVRDEGMGIPVDEIPRVCEKFFRGREVKVGGSGLGLAIVRQIIDAHGGVIRIESVPNEGTRVDVTLPLAGG